MQIEISNVTKQLGKNLVLENINLLLHSGQVYGLWGVNGSGKTMLMRAIAGLIRPTSGTITIDGKVLGKEISFPKSIGLLLESPAFLDSYTGFENLRLLAQINREINDDQICEAMQLVGLEPKDERKYRKYSLGMKQKLGIAAAIMEHPELVLLDEPTNSLDEVAVNMLSPAIRSLRNEGVLIIVSSHDKDFLHSVSDKVYHIKEGKIEGCIYEQKKID